MLQDLKMPIVDALLQDFDLSKAGAITTLDEQPSVFKQTLDDSTVAHRQDDNQDNFEFDVFISYSSNDTTWVQQVLLVKLTSAGLKVCDSHYFMPGAPILTEIERAIKTSRHTLLVLTSEYLANLRTEFESLMVQTIDPSNRKRRLIPLLKEKCNVPSHLYPFANVDLSEPTTEDKAWQQLLNTLLKKEI